MEHEFKKNKIKHQEIIKVNNSFLIFSTKIHLKDTALLYPYNLTVYKTEAFLIRKSVFLIAGGCFASYWGVYC